MGKAISTLSTVERAFEVVRTIKRLDGARVAELAEELDVAQSTAYKYLATLKKDGYLVKEGDEYHVGLRFLGLGTYARNRKEGYRLSIDKVKRVAQETGERAQFMVEENGRGVYLHTEVSEPTAVRTDRAPGKVRYLHSGASGKAILSQLPDERVKAIVETHGLPAETENTITDEDELFEELEQIRNRGVALNDEESVEGLRAVGVPVNDIVDGVVLGALGVSGPSNRLTGSKFREEFPELLLGYANEIELHLRYS